MKKSGFVFTPEARQDLIDIWEYIADDSVASADRVLNRLFRVFQQIAESPGMGHLRKELADTHYRFWPTYSYVIVYRWDIRPIQVIAVVHGARLLEAFLAQRP